VPVEDSIELDARLQVCGDHLSGEVRLPDGRAIAFDGWLGLIGAVESARGAQPVAGAAPEAISGSISGSLPDVPRGSSTEHE